MRKIISSLALLLAALLFVGAQEPRLGRSQFQVGGPSSTLLELPSAERVSISVVSPLGAEIRLVDRLEGEIAKSGAAGSRDGRIDISLDEGSYRVVLGGLDKAGGKAGLKVTPFAPANGSSPGGWPRLVDGKVVGGSLLDLQSVSYWIELRSDGPLEVEAMGRNLGLLEIWKEGNLLLGSWAPGEERQIVTGRPMGWVSASLEAKAGRYLVRLHGRADRDWSKEDGSHPYYVRSGFLPLPAGGRFDLNVSVFGRDYVSVAGADQATVSRKDKGYLGLGSSSYRVGSPRPGIGSSLPADGSSTELSLTTNLSSGESSLLAVEAAPGTDLFIDGNLRGPSGRISSDSAAKGGLLTFLAPRTGRPFLEPSGLVYRVDAKTRKVEIEDDFAEPLSSSLSYRGSVNLLSGRRLRVLLRADEAGTYRVAEKSGLGQAKALYQVYPLDFYLEAGAPYLQPSPASSASFQLTKGYYFLTIEAQSLGSLDFAVYRDRLGGGGAELARDAVPRSSRSFVLSPDASGRDIRILGGDTGLGASGYLFTPFPLDLAEGMSIDLGPGESLPLATSLAVPGRLTIGQGGAELTLGGGAPSGGQALTSGPLAPGDRALVARNRGDSLLSLRTGFSPSFDDLPSPAIADFGAGATVLGAGAIDWRDYDRGGTALYAFEVREAGMWVAETLGRLSTSLKLRSPTRTELLTASANGYGKNGALRTWLAAGRYYLEVKTLGSSKGRAGLRFDRITLGAAFELAEGVVDRRDLPADEALRYTIPIDKTGSFELFSVGLGSAFPIRIEDGEGFPVYTGAGKAKGTITPGTYTLYSLPLSLETKRLTWFKRLPPEPKPFTGAGTRRIELNQSYRATWRDGAEGDRYVFTVPSALEAVVSLPEGFSGALSGPGPSGPGPAIDLDEGDSKSLSLAAGEWTLVLRPKERNNLVDYSLMVRTDVLAPGLDSTYLPSSGPAKFSVSLPEDGWYELWSLGQVDVRASLAPAGDGRALASSDDRGPDWNFSIARYLKAGRYVLSLDSLETSRSPVTILLDERRPKRLSEAKSSYEGDLDAGPDGLVLPLSTGGSEGLYVLEAESDFPLALSLYKGDQVLAESSSRIVIPLRGSSNYDLRLSAPIKSRVHLSLGRVEAKTLDLATRNDLGKGGAFRLLDPSAVSARLTRGSLLVSSGFERPCVSPGSEAFSVGQEGGFAWIPPGAMEAALVEPLRLGDGEGAVLPLSSIDQGFLVDEPGRVVLVSASTRGLFRAGLSFAAADAAGSPPYRWSDSLPWSQGSLALLPPGSWKARVWSGDRDGAERKLGLGLAAYPIAKRESLDLGARETLSLAPGEVLALDIPASRLSALLGEDLLLEAWKGTSALALASGMDGRRAASFDLPSSTVLVLNAGNATSTLRLALLPPVGGEESGVIDAKNAWEGIGLPLGGLDLDLRAAPGDILCFAGAPLSGELAADDGSLIKLDFGGTDAPYVSIPAKTGRLRLLSGSGAIRVWLAKPGKELDGLLDQGGAATMTLKGAALLSGRGDAFKLSRDEAGFVDLSCQGPGLLSIQGKDLQTRVIFSASRDDLHLLAWLEAGEYRIWQRPIRGQAGGGLIRADEVALKSLDPANPLPAFIAAGEYQAWQFEVVAEGLVGAGIKADRDGLEAFLYDVAQRPIDKGPLMFDDLEAGKYLLLVKGLDDLPMEYSVVLAGADGSRRGVPPDVIDDYKRGGAPPTSVGLPLHARRGLHVWGGLPSASLSASPSDEEDSGQSDADYSEGDYEGEE